VGQDERRPTPASRFSSLRRPGWRLQRRCASRTKGSGPCLTNLFTPIAHQISSRLSFFQMTARLGRLHQQTEDKPGTPVTARSLASTFALTVRGTAKALAPRIHDRRPGSVTLPGTTADRRHVPGSKSLTLDQWIETTRAAPDGPPCPHCGAKSDVWPDEETDGETLVFDCVCGSHAEVVTTETEYLANAYRQLVSSCPVFVPPGPRRRLWEDAR